MRSLPDSPNLSLTQLPDDLQLYRTLWQHPIVALMQHLICWHLPCYSVRLMLPACVHLLEYGLLSCYWDLCPLLVVAQESRH